MEDDNLNISSVAKGTEYEIFVREIYETLLNADGIENISVLHNIDLKGKSGCSHQIDVYWEFKLAGQTYKTAIECKAFNTSVPIGRIRDFYGVLIDTPNLNGIFVTLVGYQSGAKAYAEHYGVTLKELRHPNEQDWKGRLRDAIANINIITQNIDEFTPVFTPEFLENHKDMETFAISCNTHDPLIFDPTGKAVASHEQLRSTLPATDAPFIGHDYTFDFPGHILKTDNGDCEINAIKIKYSATLEKSTMKISGDVFAKAIIKDVLSGAYTFIGVNGEVRNPG